MPNETKTSTTPDQTFRVTPGDACVVIEVFRADGGVSRIEVYKTEELRELLGSISTGLVIAAMQKPQEREPW